MDIRGARLSEDGKYRYKLWRQWGKRPLLGFVMLNPSTADELEDDPTIRRCIGFAKREGFGGIYVGNLFAWRATDPAELSQVNDPYGPDNFKTLYRMSALLPKIVFAWGAHPLASKAWYRQKMAFAPGLNPQAALYCLGTTKNGNPRHPLYLAASTKLEAYCSPLP